DTAAALAGGLSRFQYRGEETPEVAPARLPEALHWTCIYSGRPASTSAMLAMIAAWRERKPEAYRQHMAQLTRAGSAGTEASMGNDAERFLASVANYRNGLAELGRASGADIVSRG